MNTPKDYLNRPYARIVIPTEPKGFHAEVLEFPGCFAQGETVEEAYANLEKAAESWIETCLEQGQSVPEPSSTLTFSGRIVLRLPRAIHQRAAKLAERDKTSLNTYLVSAVAARVGAEDFYSTLAQRFERQLVHTANWIRSNMMEDQTRTKKMTQNVRVEKMKIASTPSTSIPALIWR